MSGALLEIDSNTLVRYRNCEGPAIKQLLLVSQSPHVLAYEPHRLAGADATIAQCLQGLLRFGNGNALNAFEQVLDFCKPTAKFSCHRRITDALNAEAGFHLTGPEPGRGEQTQLQRDKLPKQMAPTRHGIFSSSWVRLQEKLPSCCIVLCWRAVADKALKAIIYIPKACLQAECMDFSFTGTDALLT